MIDILLYEALYICCTVHQPVSHFVFFQKRVEEQTVIAEETREQLNTVNSDLHKTRFDLETAMRERDNLKMELSLLEARMESSKRQLEADLTSEFEKAVSWKTGGVLVM
jgi:peptidoglycan hydrolase CwlO-like protein